MTLEMDKVQNIATLNNIYGFSGDKNGLSKEMVLLEVCVWEGGYLDFHSIYHTVWIYEYIQNMNPV